MTGSYAVEAAVEVSTEVDISGDYKAPLCGTGSLTRSGPQGRLPNQHPADLTVLPPCGIYHIVVYVESRAFTRRLHQLAGASDLDVLIRFKATCSRTRLAETWFRAREGFARRGARIRRAVRESVADSVICSCTWQIETRFICCICWTRTNRRICRPMSAKRCEHG
jgi:hypothetical protein